MQSLQKIQEQNERTLAKIDHLEYTVTKKAAVAGAVAGAVSGGLSGAVVTMGLDLIRAKFGG